MIIIMAVVMVAMIAFGGTYAYFTATATGVTTGENPGHTATIVLTNKTVTGLDTVAKNALPGEQIADITATLTDGSTRNTYVFAVVTVTFEGQASAVAIGDGSILDVTIAGLGTTWKNDANFVATGASGIYYLERDNESASAANDDFTFQITVKLDENLKENNNNGEGEEDLVYMDKDVTITVQFAAIQQTGANGQKLDLRTAYEAIVSGAVEDTVTLPVAADKPAA